MKKVFNALFAAALILGLASTLAANAQHGTAPQAGNEQLIFPTAPARRQRLRPPDSRRRDARTTFRFTPGGAGG